MKQLFLAMAMATALAYPAFSQSTPYGECSESADAYQRRYESSFRASDLVCYQKALERELTSSAGSTPYDCPLSAQSYQDRYESSMRASDLVCYQKALERELR